ncbi:MAG: pseudouridine-5'-phosphate glycosidase [Acidimicrobiales bacterium]
MPRTGSVSNAAPWRSAFGGAVPALTAVIDGEGVVGVDSGDVERVLAGRVKVAARDLPYAVATASTSG